MSTYLERIAELQAKAAAADNDDVLDARSGEFRDLRTRLTDAAADAARLNAARVELASAGVAPDDQDQDRRAVLATVQALISTVQDLPPAANSDGLKAQVGNVSAYYRRVAKSLADAWRNHVATRDTSVDADLLDTLADAGVDVEQIRSDLERATSRLSVLRAKTLPAAGDVDALQQAVDALAAVPARIGSVIDPAVADIVVRAQAAGVALSELTPDVTAALGRLGILDRFRVVLT